MSYFTHFLQVFQKCQTAKSNTENHSNLQGSTWKFEGAGNDKHRGSSKYLGRHQALQGKLYSKCTNHHPADEAEKQRCLAVRNIGIRQWKHRLSLQIGILFLRRYLESYNLTRKLSYWVLPTFFNLSSLLCVKVCTVGIWYVCTVPMTLTRKVRVLTHPTNFSIKSISQTLNAWSIYLHLGSLGGKCR